MRPQFGVLTRVAVGLVGSALSLTAAPELRCLDHPIFASAVRTNGDIEALVRCAAEYLAEHGTEEARRAFNEDARWNHGSIYVFVDEIASSGNEVRHFVFPPDPSQEGLVWGLSVDAFGTDLDSEVYRMMGLVDSGWLYYAFRNPATGIETPKSSYVIEVDWNGARAVIGAGLYAPDIPGACLPSLVSASVLTSAPTSENLQAFVRCAAFRLESEGYSAMPALERDPRWSDGSSYIFVLDEAGNQVLSGNRFLVNGTALHEWGGLPGPGDQFDGRDMIRMGHAFGEAFVHYRSFDPRTGLQRGKNGFVKRVVAQGVPLLVGAGVFNPESNGTSSADCARNAVSARAVRTRRDVQAFVECAAAYVAEHGTEEAHRAFNEDERWRYGETYVFVTQITGSGVTNGIHVYPADPAREGRPWGARLADSFGMDYFSELHRVLSLVDSGWLHYSFTNYDLGREEPKSSWVKAIDWNGERAAIGAGVYHASVRGACDSRSVNASALEAEPADPTLVDFVNCAAGEVEESGLFAGPVLTREGRWLSGPIYPWAVDFDTGEIAFSGSAASYSVSGRIPELLFEGRDVLDVTDTFGSAFWYYPFQNRVTGDIETKVAYTKRVTAHGRTLIVGSGYDRVSSARGSQ